MRERQIISQRVKRVKAIETTLWRLEGGHLFFSVTIKEVDGGTLFGAVVNAPRAARTTPPAWGTPTTPYAECCCLAGALWGGGGIRKGGGTFSCSRDVGRELLHVIFVDAVCGWFQQFGWPCQ